MNKISFPGLGLDFTVNRAALQIGSFTVMWYAVMILTGLVLGTLFCCATAKKRGVNPDNITDIVLYGLVFGIIGARLYYVIFDFSEYRDSPVDIFKIWEGGLAIYGGIIGAFASTIVYCRKKKLPTLKVMDVCAPGLLIGQAIGRYGNFFNAEVYGAQTALPWGMSINGDAPVHPLFLYESLWNLLGLVLMLLLRDKKKADGQVIFSYMIWYSSGRFFLEGLRQKQYILWLVQDKIAVSQAVAVLFIMVGAVGFARVTKQRRIPREQ